MARNPKVNRDHRNVWVIKNIGKDEILLGARAHSSSYYALEVHALKRCKQLNDRLKQYSTTKPGDLYKVTRYRLKKVQDIFLDEYERQHGEIKTYVRNKNNRPGSDNTHPLNQTQDGEVQYKSRPTKVDRILRGQEVPESYNKNTKDLSKEDNYNQHEEGQSQNEDYNNNEENNFKSQDEPFIKRTTSKTEEFKGFSSNF